jgi:Flp pilus assembly protein TadG
MATASVAGLLFEEDVMSVAALRRFTADRKGNVALIFGLALLPVTFLTGMGIDYTSAARKKAILDAAADAAALAAVTPAMMASTDAASIAAATAMFNSQVAPGGVTGIPGLNYATGNLTVTATDNALTRTVTVSYTASSQNAFGGILGQQNWSLSGGSHSTASVAPNINFFLLLDNSPSMEIPATSAGLTTLGSTMYNGSLAFGGGCAFACHEAKPALESPALNNPKDSNGVVMDNYTYAKQLGVVLRIDNLVAATQSLMDTATTMEATYNSTYQMAIYTFNTGGLNAIVQAPPISNLQTAKTAAGNINVLEVYDNNNLCSNSNCTGGTGNNDEDTDFEAAMTAINNTSIMPAPGTGMAGSTPQEILLIVSDGVDDNIKNGSRNQALFDTSYCTAVKNRGIRIAVLYTEYLALPNTPINSWYTSNIAPFQSQIAANMQNCASPGLYQDVKTDQDITAAMATLFKSVVSTARLTQ